MAWLFALLTAVLWGCGDDSDEEHTYTCGSEECLSGEEYCVEVSAPDAEPDAEPVSASCEPLPADCTDCDCVETDPPVAELCSDSPVLFCTSVGSSVFRVDCTAGN
jgi:hypothetical protein